MNDRTGSEDTAVSALRQVPLLAGLDEALLAELAAVLQTEELPAGTRIFEEGDTSSSLYLIRSGKVKVVRCGAGKEVILAVLDARDYFGELSLCDGNPRSATVVSLEPTVTYVLTREAFIRLTESHPQALTHLMGVLSTRLRQTSQRLSETIFMELPARLAKRLQELAQECGCDVSTGRQIGASLTLEEVAPLVGAGAAAVDGELRALMEAGIISWDGRTVTVHLPQLLEERTRDGLRFVPIGHVNVPHWLLDA